MKKYFVFIMFLLAFSNLCFAEDGQIIKVQLDGEFINFADELGNVVNPQIINDRTMVPLRKIFEAFDCNIEWVEETRTVIANKDDTEIQLTIDEDKAIVKNASGDFSEIELDSPAVIVDDRTLVPVRFIAESLAKDVYWDSEDRTVVIVDFQKLLDIFKEKVPYFNNLSELKTLDMKSYTGSSTVKGTMQYTDYEEKTNNEKVTVKGTLKASKNEDAEELIVKLSTTGKSGKILDMLEEQNLKSLDYKFVYSNNELFLGRLEKKNYVFEKIFGSDIDVNKTFDSFDSYENFLDYIKTNLYTVDVSTYSKIKEYFDELSVIFTEDMISLTSKNDRKTIDIKLDISKLIGLLLKIQNIETNSSEPN